MKQSVIMTVIFILIVVIWQVRKYQQKKLKRNILISYSKVFKEAYQLKDSESVKIAEIKRVEDTNEYYLTLDVLRFKNGYAEPEKHQCVIKYNL